MIDDASYIEPSWLLGPRPWTVDIAARLRPTMAGFPVAQEYRASVCKANSSATSSCRIGSRQPNETRRSCWLIDCSVQHATRQHRLGRSPDDKPSSCVVRLFHCSEVVGCTPLRLLLLVDAVPFVIRMAESRPTTRQAPDSVGAPWMPVDRRPLGDVHRHKAGPVKPPGTVIPPTSLPPSPPSPPFKRDSLHGHTSQQEPQEPLAASR